MELHIQSEAESVLSQAVTIRLEDGEMLNVLHPRQIISFQGQSSQREDRFMDIAGMYRKRKLIQSRLSGPAQFMLGLPAGFCMQTIPITAGSDLLFEWKHILFYTEGMRVERKVQTFKNAVITRELVKMKFSAEDGLLGIVSNGPLHPMKLDEEQPTFVDIGSLVAYPENATLKPCVYGNSIASQHMNYHWEMTGQGYVLLQTGRNDGQLERDIEGDGFVRRVLREVIPFGGVLIR
ncbi:AIM24 family protein [Paenibacillus sp. ACRRX]|uniref:AIM24 family protein n=1 Tax=Paenibacillus sp. ACRRX TaxID=2918206 RepID=UPI001EF4080E|nr:AIM24 family protein [Paenibacillus sp. ACRRX]MCG7409089.1 AIM24 family protein [Paenibacillus sp. ACRRX]